MIKYSIIALLALALLVQPVAAQNRATLEIHEVRYDPSPAEAGGYIDLFVNAENRGHEQADNVVCELLPEFPFSLDPGENAVREIGRLDSFDTALVEYRVRVDSDAVDGENEIDIRCDVDGRVDDGTFVLHTVDITVESNRASFAIGAVTSNPEELKADEDDVELRIELQNIGEGDAKLSTATLLLPLGFSPSTSHSGRDAIGLVAQDSTAEAVFTIDIDEDVASGVYEATLVVEYKDDNNNENEYRRQELAVELEVKPSPRFVVEAVRAGTATSSDRFTGYLVQNGAVMTPSTLAQGESGELRLTIVNAGEEEAESVSVKVFEDSQNLPIEFSEVFAFLGDLAPWQSADAVFRFTIDGDAILKDYLVDAEIRYVDGTEVETTDVTVPLSITREAADNTMLYAAVAALLIAGFAVWRRKKR